MDQKEERNIDFRVPGLSHSVVKEAEHLRVQSRACKKNRKSSSWSSTSCRLAGNVEPLELCETTPKVQCFQCLLDWNQGIVYCNCGQSLIYSESRRKFHKLRLDAINLYPGLRDQERRYPWCSTRQDRNTKRIPCDLECVENML